MENWIAQALTRLFDCHRTATSRDCVKLSGAVTHPAGLQNRA